MQNIIETFLSSNGWFATFISGLALIGTFYQAYAARRQNKQSVKPFVHVYYDNEKNERGLDVLIVSVANIGLGPALIEDWWVEHNGQSYRDSQIFELFSKTFREFKVQWFRPNGGIAVNHPIKILEIIIDPTKDSYGGNLPERLEKEYVLCVKYKSFHGEKSLYKTTDHLWASKD